jgi:hypothetical protein
MEKAGEFSEAWKSAPVKTSLSKTDRPAFCYIDV